jgi:hypothetical protein
MAAVVAHAESLRMRDAEQARAKLDSLNRHWLRWWLDEASRADRAEGVASERKAMLDAIHQKHVKAGKASHSKYRAAVLAKAAEMRAEMEKNTVVQFKDAA